MAASNLIQFKRGTSAALQNLINRKEGLDGCFYLTVDQANTSGAVKDSSRLYVGRADGSIVPVNQGITTVSTTSELVDGVAHGDLHAGDFAYVTGTAANNYTDGNIFAIYDGAKWVQINSVTDTFLDTFQVAVSTTNGVATVSSQATLNQTPTNSTQTKTDSFTITGANGVTISSSGKAITVTGDPYQLSSAAPDSNATTINLGHGNNFGTSAGAIAVNSADSTHLHITGSANEITLDAPITSSVNIVKKQNNANGFNVQSTDSFGNNSNATTFDPTITYGGSADQTIHFQDGNATLNVYTKSEVDAIKMALNSMTYRGTVGTGGSSGTSISNLTTNSVGDTYKVISDLNNVPIKASNGTISTTGTAKPGDLLIANTTNVDSGGKPIEDSNGLIASGLYFDIIPSGDDIDTYYEGTAISHGWKIDKANGAGAGGNLGGIQLAEGTAITLTDDPNTTSPNKKITVAHADVNNAAITASGSNNVTKSNGVSTTFTAVTGMTVNKQGHVTGVTTKTLTLATEDGADLSAVTEAVSGTATHTAIGSNSSVTITTTAQMTKNSGSLGTAKSDSFTLSSDNLAISAYASNNNKDAKINFVWDTF